MIQTMQKLCHATKFSKTCHFKFLNNVNKKLKYYCLIDVITVYTVVNFFLVQYKELEDSLKQK